ncbi:protein phosphatase 1 regulatory subunit 12B isoform X6 [Physeter macrocephalus]|uniref:Protein phosphatase 1 regulatory subunit n=1 Tax=Physeter macrocephalus TaxID=9755 RepID=A0A455B5E8_PHYMC|nr:protein phosphatase 1 regulatory subunit 12B isoform X6 [Physeter catodon]|eukprot:XP_028344017.1 protein phosphatase 1 regulatory subunit 12B isoform X6 [Physeter catodon]
MSSGNAHSQYYRYFINHGASVGVVNSEGEVPSDLAEEPAMKDLLLQQVKKQGVDLEQSRKAEEEQMLQDARQWLNSGKIQDVRQARSGATALHVAAAKGYSEVLRLLTQAGYELNVQDRDGWTPLHAAAHWGVKEACSILAEALCDMDVRSKLGQTPLDVADEGLVEHLEMLQKKQSVLRSEKETRNKLIESDLNSKLHGRLFKNKEKMLYEEETPKPQEMEDENKESSSSSSDEDEAQLHVAVGVKHPAPLDDAALLFRNLPDSACRIKSWEPSSAVPALKARVVPQSGRQHQRRSSPPPLRPGEREKTEAVSVLWGRGGSAAPATRRRRRTATCAPPARPPSQFMPCPGQRAGPVFCFVSVLHPQRVGRSPGAERPPRPPAAEGRSGGERISADGCPFHLRDNLPEKIHQDVKLASLVQRRPPYKSQADSAAERTVDSVSCGTPLCVITNRPPPSTANGVTAAALLSTPGTDSSVEARERRRSYLTPVRDEEAESLRKARSRQARQTRRSTQGVTLTDLQEAERTFSRSRAERQAQEEPGPKPVGPGGLEGSAQKHEALAAPAEEAGESRQPWDRSLEGQPVYRRLRCPAQPDKPATPVSPPAPRPSLYTSSYLLRTGRSSVPDSESSEPPASPAGAKEMDKNEGEEADLGDQSSNRLSLRERRRPKERRRGTGINFWTKDEDETDVSEEVKAAWHERLSRLELGGSDASSERASARARREAREARLATLSSRAGEDSSRGYRKLYESALTENQKLKTKLQEAQLELADVKSKLEKMAQQKQDKTADRSSVLEMEKRERRALERKMSEMEEEMKNLHQLKQIQTLKQMNEQLQAENRALTRVVARLSEAIEGSDPQGL